MPAMNLKLRAETYLRGKLGGRKGFDLDFFVDQDPKVREEVLHELVSEFEDVLRERIRMLRLRGMALRSTASLDEDATEVFRRQFVGEYLLLIAEEWEKEID